MVTHSVALSSTRASAQNTVDALVALAHELARVNTLAQLRAAVAGPLRLLLPSRDISVLRSAHGSWEAIVGPLDGPERINQYAWTPLVVDGKTVGMLGLGAPSQAGVAAKFRECATTMLASTAQNLIAIDTLRQVSARDALTGCFTRAHAMEVLQGNMRRATRSSLEVSILMIDLDDFKAINDSYGHVPGDAVLVEVAAQLQRMLRPSDIRCRLGGDEFLVILPETAVEDALRLAESVRNAIEALEIPSVRGTIRTTASIGVASSLPEGPIDVAAFVDRADVALYRAKQRGRNDVQCCASSWVRASRARLRLAARRA